MSDEKAGFSFSEIVEPTKPTDMRPAELTVSVVEWYILVPFKSWQHDRSRVEAFIAKQFQDFYGFPPVGFEAGPRQGHLNSKIAIRAFGHNYDYKTTEFVVWDDADKKPKEMKK